MFLPKNSLLFYYRPFSQFAYAGSKWDLLSIWHVMYYFLENSRMFFKVASFMNKDKLNV